MPETISQQEAGFDFQGKFYPWKLSDTGKDLLLIDRITNMPVDEFFALAEDEEADLRGSVLLAMFATSLRAGNPSWSVERVYRTVMDLSLSDDIEILDDEEDAAEAVPTEEDQAAEQPSSSSPADESSLSSIPEETSTSET